MDQILDAPITSQQPLRYAGFWIRVAAVIIDSIILVIAIGSISLLVGIVAGITGGLIMYYLLVLFGGMFYCFVMESSAKQATYGKMAVGIKVGSVNGERLSFGNAVGRHFSKILSAMILYVGFMMAGWDKKNQALHDKIADTYVFYA
jgi:uncharacterized RDD family membrane protein YckC